jgi:hypothetical protein
MIIVLVLCIYFNGILFYLNYQFELLQFLSEVNVFHGDGFAGAEVLDPFRTPWQIFGTNLRPKEVSA